MSHERTERRFLTVFFFLNQTNSIFLSSVVLGMSMSARGQRRTRCCPGIDDALSIST